MSSNPDDKGQQTPRANGGSSGSGGSGKAEGAFLTIREVSERLGVPPHMLRFWESRFSELRPLQRGGNRRYYRPNDVALAGAIDKLLHRQGYTVKGVQKLLAEHGVKGLVQLADAGVPVPVAQPSAPLPVGLDKAALLEQLQGLREGLAKALAH